MNTTLIQFITYLESLASAHADIAHDPITHPAFIRFYEAEDVQRAARNQIQNLPCVMVKGYDFRFQDNGADNLHKVREIEFLVIEKLGRDKGYDEVYALWQATEEIGDEFVIRMKDDKKERRSNDIINMDLNQVKGVPFDMGSSALYGTMYTIPISSIRSNDPDTTKWSDLSTSP